MAERILRKTDFAREVGVSISRVSQWLGEGKIDHRALVGSGCRARINVEVALARLKETLDSDRHLGFGGKAKLNSQKAAASARDASAGIGMAREIGNPASDASGEAGERVEDRIKQARLAQLSLSNDKAREDAAARSGKFTKTDDARQEIGRATARLLTVMESSLSEMASAIAAQRHRSGTCSRRARPTQWPQFFIRNAGTA